MRTDGPGDPSHDAFVISLHLTQDGMTRYLVTGAAGFIGFHVSQKLLARGATVIGADSLNEYYDVGLKQARLDRLTVSPGFSFRKLDLSQRTAAEQLFAETAPDVVIHLAAQAGVRYSLTNPQAYIDSNLQGFSNVLEGCRQLRVQHLVYASSSSVYGANATLPFSVHHNVDHPLSLYAATKKANELMAHTYAHLYRLPVTGLRFFTVYGPWGRPDMALFLFTKAILENRPIDVFNNGQMRRDFTYVEDIAEGVVRLADKPAQPNPDWDATAPDPATSLAPYRLYNIGHHEPVQLLYLIELLEQNLGRKAVKNLLPMQPGDVPATYADIDDLVRDANFHPATPIEDGVRRFVEWYKEFYSVA